MLGSGQIPAVGHGDAGSTARYYTYQNPEQEYTRPEDRLFTLHTRSLRAMMVCDQLCCLRESLETVLTRFPM
jgi:hypothetical protein